MAIDFLKSKIECKVYKIDILYNRRVPLERKNIDNAFIARLVAGSKKKTHGCKIEGKRLIAEMQLDSNYVIQFTISVDMIFPMLCCLPAYNMNLHQLYTITHEAYSRLTWIDDGLSWQRFIQETLSEN